MIGWCERRLTPRAVLLAGLWLSFLWALSMTPLLSSHPAPWGADLAGHLTGARLILAGRADQLYDAGAQTAMQRSFTPWALQPPTRADLFVSPPFVALAYLPLALVPFGLARVLWSILSLGAIALALRLVWPVLPHRWSYGRVLCVAVCSSGAGAMLLVLGNDTAITLLVFAVGLRLLLAGHDVAAGAVLGLGAAKPQIFALIPLVLLVQRRYRAAAAFAAVFGTLALLSLWLVGVAGAMQYAALLGSPAVAGELEARGAWLMISIPALLRFLQLAPAAHVGGLAAAGLICWRFRRAARGELVPVYAAAILAGVLTAPHVFVYDGLLLLIPALVLLEQDDPRVRVALALAALACWCFVPVLAVLPLWMLLWRLARPYAPQNRAEGYSDMGSRVFGAEIAGERA